jgi:holo-[acyl-carrier protein] synthase
MSGQRILRKFPFALNLGTDICHVTRIRKILESPRGARFVQRILNDDERRHPKIQCILNNDHSPSTGQPAKSTGLMGEHHTAVAAVGGKDRSPSTTAPSLDELQLAATFMAGRYGQTYPKWAKVCMVYPIFEAEWLID